jgi:hypothetical protein
MKRSFLEKSVNQKLIVLLLLQTIVCIVCSIGHNQWRVNLQTEESYPWYILLGPGERDFMYPCTFLYHISKLTCSIITICYLFHSIKICVIFNFVQYNDTVEYVCQYGNGACNKRHANNWVRRSAWSCDPYYKHYGRAWSGTSFLLLHLPPLLITIFRCNIYLQIKLAL